MSGIKETAPRGVMLDVETTDIALAVVGTVIWGVPDAPTPPPEIGTFVTTPTPNVGSPTFPLTIHPPGVNAGMLEQTVMVYMLPQIPLLGRVFSTY